jgi:hypothetical protein
MLLEHQERATQARLEEICKSVGEGGVKCRVLVEFGVAYQAILDKGSRRESCNMPLARFCSFAASEQENDCLFPVYTTALAIF